MTAFFVKLYFVDVMRKAPSALLGSWNVTDPPWASSPYSCTKGTRATEHLLKLIKI